MGDVIDKSLLRDKRFVFTDRHDAGRQLGELVRTVPGIRDPVVVAIPAGGVPVGIEIARALPAPFALAVVRKIQVPGNSEAGFGAVTWDGRVVVNELLRNSLGLTEKDVREATEATRKNVEERIAKFTGGKPLPPLARKTVILTDDGLASGFTMLAAIKSIRELRPDKLIVAVPTASATTVDTVSLQVDKLVCLNVRAGQRFAVAEAYKRWYDLSDNHVTAELSFIRTGDRV